MCTCFGFVVKVKVEVFFFEGMFVGCFFKRFNARFELLYVLLGYFKRGG